MSTVLTPRPTVSPDVLEELRARVRGTVSVPGDPGYDEARIAWNLAVDQRPAVLVAAEVAQDVVAAVQVAGRAGLRVAPQATGHGAHLLGGLESSILVRTDAMRAVSVDPMSRTVRAEAGALWQDVVGVVAEHDLCVMHGSAPDVGVVGYTLGGGLSWHGRRLGLACNHVRAIEVVTAKGELVRADAQERIERFWAMRGGGGAFGIVTAIEFAAHPIPPLSAGWLVWPWEEAERVLTAWARWTRTAPDDIQSIGRLMQLPPSPDVPEPLRGRQLVVIEIAAFMGPEEADALIAPLRDLKPELDLVAPAPITALADLHKDPPPVPFAADHTILERLTGDAVRALLEVAGPGTGSRLISAELRHLGGALAAAPVGAGARSHIDGEFLFFAVGATPTPYDGEMVAAQAEAAVHALEPWAAPVGFTNFADGGGPLHDEATAGLLARLQGYMDPAGIFQASVDHRSDR